VRLARRAIEAGKEDPDALWMAGWTLAVFAGEHATAANVIDRALTLNPNSAYGWMARGSVSVFRNRPEAAIEGFKRAIRLSPVDPLGARAFAVGLAVAHLTACRYEQAIDWADRSLAAQPDYRSALRIKAACCAHLGRLDEARDCLRRLLELEPDLTISRFKASLAYLSPEILDRYTEGLQKAGLPEE
jgi:adenylate cyclase